MESRVTLPRALGKPGEKMSAHENSASASLSATIGLKVDQPDVEC
jgi:hypothetical protein